MRMLGRVGEVLLGLFGIVPFGLALRFPFNAGGRRRDISPFGFLNEVELSDLVDIVGSVLQSALD